MSESKAPTPDEVARLRSHVASCQRHKLASATVDTAQLVALLAALDAAERERERDVAGFASIRRMLRQSPPDVARAILWCDDSLSGYVETQGQTEADLSARAETAEARVAELEAGLRALADEYGPSDCRTRCLRLLGPSGSNGGGA